MISKIKVSSCKSNLKTVRDFVSETLKGYSMPETDIDMMVLAIDEICSNIIIHCNNCNEKKEVEVNINVKIDLNGVLFEIFYNGRAYDYELYQEPNIKDLIANRCKGGMGLMLVRRIMDKIEFHSETTYNVCRLFKKITPLATI